MDLTALELRCKTRFRDADHDIVSEAEWFSYLNDAYGDVQAATPFWPWAAVQNTAMTAAIGVRTVALPTNVYRVTAVLNATEGVRMSPFEGVSEHLERYPDGTDSGPPVQYRVYGLNLHVYPKPSVTTTLTVEYTKSVAELSAPTDVPVFPAEFHRILVEGALSRAYTDDANLQQAAAHDAAFTGLLATLKDALLQPQQERYHQIVDTFWA